MWWLIVSQDRKCYARACRFIIRFELLFVYETMSDVQQLSFTLRNFSSLTSIALIMPSSGLTPLTLACGLKLRQTRNMRGILTTLIRAALDIHNRKVFKKCLVGYTCNLAAWRRTVVISGALRATTDQWLTLPRLRGMRVWCLTFVSRLNWC